LLVSYQRTWTKELKRALFQIVELDEYCRDGSGALLQCAQQRRCDCGDCGDYFQTLMNCVSYVTTGSQTTVDTVVVEGIPQAPHMTAVPSLKSDTHQRVRVVRYYAWK
jgi:hypothetical protein